MTSPSTISGTRLLIKVGDGASPQVFVHPCLINAERGIQWGSTSNDDVVPDCDAPEAPGWNQTTKDGLNATITGAGKLDTSDIAFWDTWFRSDDAKTIQVWVADKGYWSGEFKLTEWSITGDRGSKATVSLTLKSDGEVGAFTAAPVV
ncbi:Phage tail tube protein [Faunimonas pinastri]|uniref:Phage tail tube protein n=1 Tax=Faunimonas pinastri TaxID=1855383 RepID=A0A1H9F532_9HYPH|nr:phage tail tube protein [Faunimonas pinastri]SEQ33031.1 Phage tail tube protein [Faunimonas pinastri]